MTIWTPTEFVDSLLRILDLEDWSFRVLGKIPELEETLSVSGDKQSWVDWVPLRIVDVIVALEGVSARLSKLGCPEFGCPVVGAGEHESIQKRGILVIAGAEGD